MVYLISPFDVESATVLCRFASHGNLVLAHYSFSEFLLRKNKLNLSIHSIWRKHCMLAKRKKQSTASFNLWHISFVIHVLFFAPLPKSTFSSWASSIYLPSVETLQLITSFWMKLTAMKFNNIACNNANAQIIILLPNMFSLGPNFAANIEML